MAIATLVTEQLFPAVLLHQERPQKICSAAAVICYLSGYYLPPLGGSFMAEQKSGSRQTFMWILTVVLVLVAAFLYFRK